ncbi:enoyl-CoA hydratase-related protein [Pseudonocardia sp. WMMC193]|uniref:enoyl-CoA hydratase-related protein n=1 Tax=Pseudonocardia sp. WMMC193 TaxID=2911965 RepID=UPI001F021FF6|nr:enoyl-CoA hydratase-related protein [Pseudonocardia sp. WMMC193]MCF7553475.1 enoyl-CoA hydratase-related protein [Pseudonocardia sp. WMMC193]
MARLESTEHVHVSRPEPGVAVLELARGAVNALDHATYAELGRVWDAVSADEEIRAVVLTGRGDVFCAGNDLNDFAVLDGASAEAYMQTVRRSFAALLECAVPVIAAVHGAALGSGLGLVASADLVVASERATFGLPEMTVGVLGGGRFTARMLPEQAMRRMFFTAEPVDARTFAAWGAPVEVVAHEDLRPAALRLARSVAAKDRSAVILAKQSLNGCEPLDLQAGYRFEQTFTVRMIERRSG